MSVQLIIMRNYLCKVQLRDQQISSVASPYGVWTVLAIHKIAKTTRPGHPVWRENFHDQDKDPVLFGSRPGDPQSVLGWNFPNTSHRPNMNTPMSYGIAMRVCS